MNKLLLVIDLCVELVEVPDQSIALERHFWRLVIGILVRETCIELVPFFVEQLSFLIILSHSVQLLHLRVHLEGIVEGKWVDLFEDCLEGNERLLQDLVPVVLRQVHDNWNQHWERFLLVGLQNVEEVIILEKAHSSVSHLQMDATNALDDSLEQLWNQRLNLVDLAYLEHLLKLRQE